MNERMTRVQAYELLKKYMKSEALLRHSVIVEGVMRHFAELDGGDVEAWGMLGLLHDIDFELYPEEHCSKCAEILAEEGFDPAFIRSVQSHGFGLCSDVAPESRMEQVLYTIDELTGLVYAAVLMRPSKRIADLETKSVMKKFKTASFAANVNRDVIRNGADMLGMSVEEVITETIAGMKKIADEIGI